MTTEPVGQKEYEERWTAHRAVHATIEERLDAAAEELSESRELRNELLSELKDIKWLVLLLMVGSLPHVIEFLKGLIHP